jgi:hydrogenase nickel incorporation protein HypA/HybF
MHEIGLCEGILESVERRAAGRPVTRVRVRAGALHRVDPESMAFGFGLVSAGTIADGAHLDLEVIPATVTCGDCGAAAETTDPYEVCRTCGSTDVRLSGGDELTLESLTYAGSAVGAEAPTVA